VDQLKHKTLQGLMYLGVGKGAGKLISFVNTLLLARLLSPEDYGLMAIVMVIVGFIGFFNEIGLGSAIKQRLDINQQQLNGCFTLALLISSLLYLGLYFASPAIASYFEHDILTDILRFIAFTFILGAIIAVPDALIARDMRFKIYAGIEFVTIILQCAITLMLAWYGFKVWALAWGFVAAQCAKTCFILYFSNWVPSRFGNIREASDLMKFGATVTYSRITWYFYNNASTLIIVKVLNPQQLGIYSMAATLAALPTLHITSMVIQIASPLFSKLQQDFTRLNNALLRLTSGIALIGFPIMLGMALTSSELVPVMLGPQWFEAIFPLQILCIIGLFKSVDPLITQAFISVGKANITARYTTLCALMIPIGVYTGAIYGGLIGVAIGLVVTYPLSSIYLFYAARIHLEFSMRRYLKALQTPLEACLIMAVCVFGFEYLSISIGFDSLLWLLISKTLIGILSYVLFLVYVRQSGLKDCYEVLLELGVSKQKINRWPFTLLKDKTSVI
jgi:O-antigen/teichoic acid export membrane protein